jgi:tetratricopeptide (TPR) repeat protein
MSATQQFIIRNAVQSIEGGDCLRAKSILQEGIKRGEGSSEIHRLLGIAQALLGNKEDAIKHFQKALEKNKKNSYAYLNLGNVYKEDKDLLEAEKNYKTAIKIDGNPEAHHNLGMLYEDAGNILGAIDEYKICINKIPNYLDSILNLSAIYINQGSYDEAGSLLEKALRAGVNHSNVYINYGFVLNEKKNYVVAEELLKNRLNMDPLNPKILLNLGNSLMGQNKYNEALESYAESLKYEPQNPNAYSNIGHVYAKLKKYDESEEFLKKSIQIEPNLESAWTNLGVTYFEQGRLEEAFETLNKAISINADYADAHLNLAHVNFQQFDFLNAWKEYEWRWKSRIHESPAFRTEIPIWAGEKDKNILIWSEQGIGDQILFSGLFFDVLSASSKVTVLTDERLVPIFSRTYPEIRFKNKSTFKITENFDFQISICSLGGIFRKGHQDFGRKALQRLLVPDPQLLTATKSLITKSADKTKKVCGLSWVSTNLKLAEDKSIALESLMPILEIEGVSFIDVQYLNAHQERKLLNEKYGIDITKFDEIDSLYDLESVFALLQNCDFVVTVSNSVAHMAAAIGKPTFVLLPYGAGKFWYWMNYDGQNLWYENAISVAQEVQGCWDFPVLEIKRKIKELLI